MDRLKRLYIDTKDALFAYLVRMSGDYQLSKDIMQESYSRLLARYNPESFNKSLLFTIARNLFYDTARKNRAQKPFQEERWQGVGNPEKDMLIKESYRQVLGAMQQLDPLERDILALVVSSGMTYRAIAEIMQLSEANVKVKVHRARLKLRKRLEQEDS